MAFSTPFSIFLSPSSLPPPVFFLLILCSKRTSGLGWFSRMGERKGGGVEMQQQGRRRRRRRRKQDMEHIFPGLAGVHTGGGGRGGGRGC